MPGTNRARTRQTECQTNAQSRIPIRDHTKCKQPQKKSAQNHTNKTGTGKWTKQNTTEDMQTPQDSLLGQVRVLQAQAKRPAHAYVLRKGSKRRTDSVHWYRRGIAEALRQDLLQKAGTGKGKEASHIVVSMQEAEVLSEYFRVLYHPTPRTKALSVMRDDVQVLERQWCIFQPRVGQFSGI